jgi:hypothetical protein
MGFYQNPTPNGVNQKDSIASTYYEANRYR